MTADKRGTSGCLMTIVMQIPKKWLGNFYQTRRFVLTVKIIGLEKYLEYGVTQTVTDALESGIKMTSRIMKLISRSVTIWPNKSQYFIHSIVFIHTMKMSIECGNVASHVIVYIKHKDANWMSPNQ